MSGKLSERRRHAEENESEDYADVIRNVDWIRPDWTALNGRIIDEFGHAGLLRIKRRAWQIIEEAFEPTATRATTQTAETGAETDDPRTKPGSAV